VYTVGVYDGRGYHLPDGDAYTDELRCAIVFYPAKDEYLYALGGSLDYLGTWLAWERDDDKRGKDAARAWKDATELTRECWSMAFCNDILNALLRIETLLGKPPCCDGSTTYFDVENVTTTIIPDSGPDPTEWGETAVADWDEWKEYVCYHAHKFVDGLVSSAETMDTIAEIGSWTIELISNFLRALKFLTLVYPVSYAAALEIYQSFLDAGDMSDTFDNAAADFEAARTDIVCAILQGDSLSDAVEDALNDAALWTLLYQHNNYDNTQALIYDGTVDGTVYLPPIKRDDCVCSELEEGQLIPNPEFEEGATGWTLVAPWVWASGPTGAPPEYGILTRPAYEGGGTWGCESPRFVIPVGIGTVNLQAHIWDSSGRDQYMYVQIKKDSDDSTVWSDYIKFGDHGQSGSNWDTLNFPATSAVDAGETYYMRWKCEHSWGAAAAYIDFIKCWTVP
jgi:hypothetical protein